MEIKFKKINYWFNEDEESFKQKALILFDMLGCKQNIAISFFRAAHLDNLFEFQKLVQCKVLYDIKRQDNYCVLVPEINSNNNLALILKNNYAFPTEFSYINLITDYDTFLFNQKYLEKGDAVSCGLAKFNAFLDHEGIHLMFNLDFFELKKLEFVLQKWEKEVEYLKYFKK